MEFAVFPPGSSVWFWTGSLKEPVEVIVDDVCIWVNERGTTVSYTFKTRPEKGVYGRVDSDSVFATQAEGVAKRDKWIAAFRQSMGIT